MEGSAQGISGAVWAEPQDKWRKRAFVNDAPMGPKTTVLSSEEEAIIVAFRKHTLLPLDDCLYALQATIPALTGRLCIGVLNATRSAVWRRSPVTGPLRNPSSGEVHL
jgi:hypothetical protein